MRRLILVNALIFAVLAAAFGLAYYGFSSVPRSDLERQLMHDLAEEKVLNIESILVRDDKNLLNEVRLDQVEKLDDQVKATDPNIASVFVLDDHLELVPSGSWSVATRNSKEAIAIRDWFLTEAVSHLDLKKQPLDTRGHMYGRRDDIPYLLSFMRKQLGDRTYYVVIEDDLNHLVFWLFPQFFSENSNENSKRLYQVVDERGAVMYGLPFAYESGGLVASIPFVETLDGVDGHWQLRVTERDPSAAAELSRKRIIDSLLIGGAVTVILAGLAFLAIAIRRERRSNELKSDFISNVSHELKTPLSIISMFGEMLANQRTKSPEQATEYAEIIWRESVRLGRLIDNVLDFAKIERGMGVYEFAESDVAEVVTRAIDLAARRLATAEMTLESTLEPELPMIQLDGNAFTLAVLNLIDNAIKYAADGKKIRLDLRRDGERIVLSVNDFGPGIDPDEQERIFERFYRARAMRLKPIRGSGIRLALVQHIARAHGGDVTVESSVGQGSTFKLWLPIA